MTNERNNPIPPPAQPNRSGRWILVAMAAILLVYLGQKLGCGPVQTQEKVEWIDR